jgi:hypothetical protein
MTVKGERARHVINADQRRGGFNEDGNAAFTGEQVNRQRVWSTLCAMSMLAATAFSAAPAAAAPATPVTPVVADPMAQEVLSEAIQTYVHGHQFGGYAGSMQSLDGKSVTVYWAGGVPAALPASWPVRTGTRL